jgi:uncharacterized protein
VGKQQKIKSAKKNVFNRLEAFEKIGLPVPTELAAHAQAEFLLDFYGAAAGRFLEPIFDEVTPIGLRQGTHESLKFLDTYLAVLPTSATIPGLGFRTIACSPGCNYCCTHPVTTSAPIVIALAFYLRKKLSEEEISGLLERIEAHVGAGNRMTPLEQSFRRRMCPLNVEGRCIGYEYRPFSCRGYNSYDAAQCKSNMESEAIDGTVPHDEDRTAREALVTAATGAVTEAVGLNDDELEFVPALLIALTEDNVAERYIAGERVFAKAHRPEVAAAESDYFARRGLSELPQV